MQNVLSRTVFIEIHCHVTRNTWYTLTVGRRLCKRLHLDHQWAQCFLLRLVVLHEIHWWYLLLCLRCFCRRIFCAYVYFKYLFHVRGRALCWRLFSLHYSIYYFNLNKQQQGQINHYNLSSYLQLLLSHDLLTN